MRASLNFTLPEEAIEHRMALDGPAWRSVVADMDEWLLSEVKHSEGDTTPYEYMRTVLHEAITDNDLTL